METGECDPHGMFCNLLHECLFDLPMTPHELARKLGKPYSTLMREVNPNDCAAKLGVSTFFAIMKISGDVTPLDFMARQLGYKLTKL